jgi:hypothetical protein
MNQRVDAALKHYGAHRRPAPVQLFGGYGVQNPGGLVCMGVIPIDQ